MFFFPKGSKTSPMAYETISKSHLAAARAVDQLRRQLGVVLLEKDGKRLGAMPIEGLTPALMQQLQSYRPQHLLLTSARARWLKLPVPEGAQGVRIAVDGLSLDALMFLSDPLAAEMTLPKLTLEPATDSDALLLTMARYAGLLPALLTVEGNSFPDEWVEVPSGCARTYWEKPLLDMVPVVEAKLPTVDAEDAKLICFRQRYGTSTHLALVIGDIAKAKDGVLTRVHSSCITGDILGSLRCDCGDQLKLAIQQIEKEGCGILLYLHQEGRGIGIANKLRAYQLQERGVDTYDANLMLGFAEDERDFSIAAAILNVLKVDSIRLLTNNPRKLAELEKHGVKLRGRVPAIIPAGAHNHNYLDAKAKKAGHMF